MISLKQYLESYVNTLPVLEFNSWRYYLNLIKSYLIPYLTNDKEAEEIVIKKANNFISFKFEDKQFPRYHEFLVGATSRDYFLKTYKARETKLFFPQEWFDSADKLDNEALLPYEAFLQKLLQDADKLSKSFATGSSSFEFFISARE